MAGLGIIICCLLAQKRIAFQENWSVAETLKHTVGEVRRRLYCVYLKNASVRGWCSDISYAL